jgi:PAS domain S-box-containing protein
VLRLHAALDAAADADALAHTLPVLALERARADRAVLLLPAPGDAGLRAEAQAWRRGGELRLWRRDGTDVPADDLPAALLDAARRSHRALLLADGAGAPARPVRALLALPLRHGETVAGVLVLERAPAARAFAPARVAELELLAGLAAAAWQRLRQLERLQRENLARHRAALALHESAQRFALAVAGSSDGIWDWNLLDDQVFLSEQAQRLYGLQPDPASTRPRPAWRALVRVHPEDLALHRRLLAQHLAQRAPVYDGEWRVLHDDGQYRWVRTRGLCVRDATGRPTRMAGSVSDVDARRRAEAALQQAQRLEAVGTLAGGVAHDFNNILGAILGFGESALRHTRAGSRLRRDLECIVTAGERGRALVERLLTFSRSGVSERVPVHVEREVREALALLEGSLPPLVSVRTALNAGSAALLGDATQVHQLLMNLATNAIQAMPGGGTLRVTLETATLPAARMATTGPLRPGAYLVLAVADEGTGIPAGIRERIFDPFFTTKDVGTGTGLGLSLVHGIVTELGGAVDLATTPGAGSTFTVYLPRSGEVPPLPEVAAAPRPAPGMRQRVMVVDDEAALVQLAAEALCALGYVAEGFTSGTDALAAFEADPWRFDALLTDARMPHLGGPALMQAVRALRPALPVVLVSGYADAQAAGGADAVLGKPLQRQALAAALARVFETRDRPA